MIVVRERSGSKFRRPRAVEALVALLMVQLLENQLPQGLAMASTQIDAHTGNRTPVTSMEGLYDATTLCVR